MEIHTCALQQIPLSSLQYYELVLHTPDQDLACCSSYLRGSKRGTLWKLLPRDQADPIVPLNPRPEKQNLNPKPQNPQGLAISIFPMLVCVFSISGYD